MKRPVGIILTAIVLGLFAGLTLLMALAIGFSAIMMRTMGAGTTTPGNPNPAPAALLTGVFVVMVLLFLAAAAWEIVTLVGLLKLKNWARYSVMVLGGLLAFFGVTSGLLILAVPQIVNPQTSSAAQLPPHTMQAIVAVVGLFYLGMAAVGIWWLVFYNLRSTKNYFLPAYAIDPVFYGGATGDPQLYQGSVRPPGRFTSVPVSVLVLACLYLLSLVSCAVMAFVSVPAFFCGLLFHGMAGHVFYAAFAVVMGLLGWGLLRLDNRARLGVYAFSALGLLNFLILITPWGRGRYAAYNDELYGRLYGSGLSMTPHAPDYASHMMVFLLGFCLVFYGVQIWILERSKPAFH